MRVSSRSKKILLIGSMIIFLLLLCNSVYIKEGFVNPFGNHFQDLIRRIRELQDKDASYNKWVGYLYKNAPINSNILNDFKKRVFQPSCKFRRDWADNLPKNSFIPTPANSNTDATIAYKNYMKCLSEGNNKCIQPLNDARVRFMEPDCAFLNPQDSASYSKEFTVAFN